MQRNWKKSWKKKTLRVLQGGFWRVFYLIFSVIFLIFSEKIGIVILSKGKNQPFDEIFNLKGVKIASKKEENQLIRTILPTLTATFVASVGYIGSGKETREPILIALVFCSINCLIGIVKLLKKHIKNANEIED